MLLDTNALSAWAESDAALFRRVPMDRPWFVSTITLGEYRFGLIKSIRRIALENWLETIEADGGILVPDLQTARVYAHLRDATARQGRNLPYHDLWIAALGVQHSLAVVTQDKHFDLIPGIRRIGW